MSSQLPKPGDTIGGQFVLRRELGRGAHGVVFEAQQLGLERQVAIKMLLPEVLEDDGIVERFKREARLASALSSPHSVIIHAFGVHDLGAAVQSLPYLAMEYLHGEDLGCYLRRVGTLTVEQTTVIIRQVLASLSEAHRKGIVHRDLKPENIFLSQRDDAFVVKVLDFGIAKAIADNQGMGRRLTADGMVCGTPEYMAPEQAKGLPEITPAVDVYAVGCIIYHMLSGRPPFLGPTPMTIALKHCQDPPPKLPPSVKSPFFREVVRCALSKEPGERYRDANELFGVVEEHYAASLGAGASGSWRAAEPPSQEFGLKELPGRGALDGAVPDWALTTSPSMNAFRSPGDAAEAVDLPARGRFPVAVGDHIDAGFSVESAEQPTIMDFDEPELLEDTARPQPAPSGRHTAEGSAATLQVPIFGASAPKNTSSGGYAPVRPEEATERRIFLALALGAGLIFLLLTAGLGVLFFLSAPEEPAAPPRPPVEAGAGVRLSVASSPSGAQVFEGEELLGETPLLVERPRADATVVLTLRRSGYKDAAVELSLKRSSVHNKRLQRLAGDGWADKEKRAAPDAAEP